MKKKLKNWWKKVQAFFKNSTNRLFAGAALIIIAVLLRAGVVAAYTGIYISLALSIIWIILAVFYFIMCLWAIQTR